ncbi:hypothetical protein [Aliidiomarina celeris]|uniref:hypothetical protein n=1 Tax=Aliidiomarina celeris TaxID=2249428 RepID=UPI0013001AF2|nr:hypothetical protein [Aliidiomarina celeris]
MSSFETWKEKFKALPSGAQVLISVVVILILAGFLFSMGANIGSAIYNAIS